MRRTGTRAAAGRSATSVGDHRSERGAVGGGQRLRVAAGDRQHDVRRPGRPGRASTRRTKARVQERQVGGADEGHGGGPVAAAASPTAMPCSGPRPSARVVDDLAPRAAGRAAPGPGRGRRPPGRRPRGRRCRPSGAAASSRATPAPPWGCPSATSARPRARHRPSSRPRRHAHHLFPARHGSGGRPAARRARAGCPWSARGGGVLRLGPAAAASRI